jgi:hypothetical protein
VVDVSRLVPLNEHSGGLPEEARSGGRPGDHVGPAPQPEVECLSCGRCARCVRASDGTVYRPIAWTCPGASAPLVGICPECQSADWSEFRLEGCSVPGVLPAPLSVEDAVELERLTALSSEELDVELAVLGVDPAPFLERVRTFVATLPEVRPLPPLEFTIELEHDEAAALPKPGDRPVTAREAGVMAGAIARAVRAPLSPHESPALPVEEAVFK